MNLLAENYGAVLIIRVDGRLGAEEAVRLVDETTSKAGEFAAILFALDTATLPIESATPFLELQKMQRFSRPMVLVSHPTLSGAAGKSLFDALALVEGAEARQVAKLETLNRDFTTLGDRRAAADLAIRKNLELSATHTPEDFDVALGALRSRHSAVRKLAAAMGDMVARLRKTRPLSEADSGQLRRILALKKRAYEYVVGAANV